MNNLKQNAMMEEAIGSAGIAGAEICNWEEEFHQSFTTDDDPQNEWHKTYPYHIISFIKKVEAEAYERGKEYYEPSEYHKNIWRKEGAKKRENELILPVLETIKQLKGVSSRMLKRDVEELDAVQEDLKKLSTK